MTIRDRPAHLGNYTPGRQGQRLSLIVIHVMDGTQEGTAAWFAQSRANASAHYGVSAKGEIDRYVREDDTAWHAGSWSVNVRSVGLEHEGRHDGAKPWQPSPAQFRASVKLAADICYRHNIAPSPETIVTHASVSARKPLCPGAGFPLERYIREVVEAVRELHAADGLYVPVRLFHPVTNEHIGNATLVRGTDKVYLKTLEGRDFK